MSLKEEEYVMQRKRHTVRTPGDNRGGDERVAAASQGVKRDSDHSQKLGRSQKES